MPPLQFRTPTPHSPTDTPRLLTTTQVIQEARLPQADPLEPLVFRCLYQVKRCTRVHLLLLYLLFLPFPLPALAILVVLILLSNLGKSACRAGKQGLEGLEQGGGARQEGARARGGWGKRE